jgi:hypothetical protein
VGAALLAAGPAVNTILAAEGDMAPLPLKLPMPTAKGTPDELPKGPHIEPLTGKPRPQFMAPAGVVNVALKKKVAASDPKPITGEPSQVTDGLKEAFDDHVMELHKKPQHVTIDLEGDYAIHAIVLWNDHRYVQVFHDVIIQVADDAEFTKNVRTIFNNDMDNSAGLGAGTDKEYFETHEGKLLDTKGVKARAVRWYSQGSSLSALNCRTEIEVYALPAK